MPRSKPHFKVITTIQNHPKMADVWTDNDLLATWVRLGVLAIERYADRHGNSFLVSDRELLAITGKGRLDVARTWLGRLADVSPTSAERNGNVWQITIPNLAQKQGFGLRNGKESETPSSSASSSTSYGGKSANSEPESEAENAAIASPQQFIPKRDRLAAARIRELADLRPKGINYSPADVAAWYASRASKMRRLGKKNLWRTAVNWFQNATFEEVQDGLRWVSNQHLEEHRKRAPPPPPEPTAEDVADLEAFLGGEDP